MDNDVEFAVGGLELLEDGVDVSIDGDVAAEGFGVRQVGGKLVGIALETLVLVADGEGGACFGELLGNEIGRASCRERV